MDLDKDELEVTKRLNQINKQLKEIEFTIKELRYTTQNSSLEEYREMLKEQYKNFTKEK